MKTVSTAEKTMTDNITSDTLIALRLGDHTAYEKVYNYYKKPIKDFLATIIKSEEAEEILQDIFLTLWEKREKIDPYNNLSGFLYKIARNSAFKFYDHKKVIGKHISSLEGIIESDISADEIMINKEKEKLWENLINKMPPKRRYIYRLSRIEELSNYEIAQKLNISKNTVENHITSALKNLREAVCYIESV